MIEHYILALPESQPATVFQGRCRGNGAANVCRKCALGRLSNGAHMSVIRPWYLAKLGWAGLGLADNNTLPAGDSIGGEKG